MGRGLDELFSISSFDGIDNFSFFPLLYSNGKKLHMGASSLYFLDGLVV